MTDFVSLKDLFGNPEFQEKVKLGTEAKKNERAGYTHDTWEKIKSNLDVKCFPDQFFASTVRPKQDNTYISHKGEGQEHSLLSYVKNVRHNWAFDSEWRFVYCPTCKKTIYKLGTVLNKVENLSYTRWYVRNGKDEAVTQVREEEKATEPEIVFDGNVPTDLSNVLERQKQ